MQLALVLFALGSGAAHADEAKGAALYQANCSTCHGEALDGKGPAGAALQPPPSSFKSVEFWKEHDTKAVKAAIKNGSPGTAMMAFAHLPDEDVDAIVAYLVANKP